MCAVIKRKGRYYGRSHMEIPWHQIAADESVPIKQSRLEDRATVIGRVGLMVLGNGTGAWRVRDAMNIIARVIGVNVSADIGLTSILFTVSDGSEIFTQNLNLVGTGINTERLMLLEHFVDDFVRNDGNYTLSEINQKLDAIQHSRMYYSKVLAGLFSGLACSSFTFLLGGGIIEMIGAFIGASVGYFLMKVLRGKNLQHLLSIVISIASACLSYYAAFSLLSAIFNISPSHEAGYIGSMLFIIPGFVLITAGLDIAKQDMRSGIERLMHGVTIILVATLTGWLVAMAIHFNPMNFQPLGLSPWTLFLLRLPASFCGVFGFSTMYNSRPRVAATAGLVGMVTNTLRLELVDLFGIPGALACFIAAFCSGIISAAIHHRLGYPRIALTVPSIVIMVPGMFMYKAMYFLGTGDISQGNSWLTKAVLMVCCMPIGLLFARVITDRRWRFDN